MDPLRENNGGEIEPTASDIARAMGKTERAIQLRARKEGWLTTAKAKRGGKQRRYIFRLLPEDVRQAGAVVHAEKRGLVPVDPKNLPAVLPNDMPAIPDTAREIGLAKYRLVHAFRKAANNAPWGKKSEFSAAFLLAYNAGQLMPKVHETLGDVAVQTLRALDKKLLKSKDNYVSLCDGRGGWKVHGTNKWRSRSLSEESKKALLKCYLSQQRPTVAMSIRAARYTLDALGIDERASDDTFRRWLKEYGEKNGHVLALARDGEKAYKDQFQSYITRDLDQLNVGDCVVADGKVLNFQVLHPVSGKPCRMALIIWMDWRSRFPAGWQLMPTENTIAVASALRMAIMFLGMIPKVAYMDNGKAFKNKVFLGEDVDLMEMTGLFARLGIATMFAIPFNAKAKINERFHLTMQEQGERMFPSFSGTSISDKPAHMMRNEKFHQAWHQAQTSGWIPDIREAAHLIGSYFTYYVNQPHSGLGGDTPLSVLEAGRGPGVDVQALNHEFLWRKTVTPRRCRVKLYGIDYESDALHGITHPMTAMYDTANMETIWVYTPDGQYVDEANAVQAIHPVAAAFGDQVGLDRVKYEMARQNRMLKRTKQQLLALGASMEDMDGLKSLPYVQKQPVIRTTPAINDKPEQKALPAGEVKRLEDLADKTLADMPTSKTAPDRPGFFRSDLDRYEWCFYAVHRDGFSLSSDDSVFMAQFENSRVFAESYKERFDGLRGILPRENQAFGIG